MKTVMMKVNLNKVEVSLQTAKEIADYIKQKTGVSFDNEVIQIRMFRMDGSDVVEFIVDSEDN